MHGKCAVKEDVDLRMPENTSLSIVTLKKKVVKSCTENLGFYSIHFVA